MCLHNLSDDLPRCALRVPLSYTQGANSDLLSGLGTISDNAVLKYTVVWEGERIDARIPGGGVGWGWTDKLIHYGGVGRVDKMHSITTRQGVRERGTAHWARVVPDYGVALPGRQGWRCIEWLAAQHDGVEGVCADELMVGGGGHTI